MGSLSQSQSQTLGRQDRHTYSGCHSLSRQFELDIKLDGMVELIPVYIPTMLSTYIFATHVIISLKMYARNFLWQSRCRSRSENAFIGFIGVTVCAKYTTINR